MNYQPLLVTIRGETWNIADYQYLLPTEISFPLTSNNPDIKILQPSPKKQSTGVEEAKEFTSWLQLKPFQHQLKLGIIPKAGSLTTAAQNSLLKTLEEPTQGTLIWIFTDNLQALLPTIRSRCREINVVQVEVSEQTELKKLANNFLATTYLERVDIIEQLQQVLSVKQQQQLIGIIMHEIVALPNASPKRLAMLETAKLAYKALGSGVSPKLTWETLGISIDLENS